MENPRRVLGGILFADALLNLPLMILLIILMREIIRTPVPFWVTALGIFTVIVLLCDLIPKVVALSKPYRIASTGLLTLQTVLPLVDPIARRLQILSEKVADLFFANSEARARPLTEEELETLIELSEEQGSLGAIESEMIQEIIKLGNKTVRDCMTPRTDMFALPDDLENAEVIAKVKARRFRRVPVYGETPDEILGVLDVKRFLFDPRVHYMEVLVTPSYVPETMKALDLLRNLLMRPDRLAIIVDEFGGTEGIITLADIIEEIISDAVPAADHTLYIQEIGTEKWLVNAAARLDDLSEHLGIELEEDGIDTVGGLVFTHFGSLPRPGEQIRLGDLVFTVRKSSRKRIEEIVVVLDPEDKEEKSGE
jgi:putative hemolysin